MLWLSSPTTDARSILDHVKRALRRPSSWCPHPTEDRFPRSRFSTACGRLLTDKNVSRLSTHCSLPSAG